MEVLFGKHDMFYKPELRKSLREKRRHLDIVSVQQASKQVAVQIIMLTEFIESKTIGSYIAQENELDPAATIQSAQQSKKQFYLPVIPNGDNKTLSFYPYHSNEALVPNRYHILEPKTDSQDPISTQTLDIIFVPLVGFDKDCNRLGRGAGYYDHTLAFTKDAPLKNRPLLIGLGYEFQKSSEIVPSKWDVPLDIIVTEKTVYRRFTRGVE